MYVLLANHINSSWIILFQYLFRYCLVLFFISYVWSKWFLLLIWIKHFSVLIRVFETVYILTRMYREILE